MEWNEVPQGMKWVAGRDKEGQEGHIFVDEKSENNKIKCYLCILDKVWQFAMED